jgi:hypothetical protein
VTLTAPPPLARRYLKASVGFFVYGILIGLHISAALHLGWGTFRGGYVAAHTHVLLIGFVAMLLAGLALWRFPEPKTGSWVGLPEASWWLLVLTVVGRSTSEILTGYFAWRGFGAAVFLISGLQACALAALAMHLLGRATAAGAPP